LSDVVQCDLNYQGFVQNTIFFLLVNHYLMQNYLGQHSTAVAVALHYLAAPGSNHSISNIFSEIFLSFFDVAMLIDCKDSEIKLNS
jgi:hypothetical protein